LCHHPFWTYSSCYYYPCHDTRPDNSARPWQNTIVPTLPDFCLLFCNLSTLIVALSPTIPRISILDSTRHLHARFTSEDYTCISTVHILRRPALLWPIAQAASRTSFPTTLLSLLRCLPSNKKRLGPRPWQRWRSKRNLAPRTVMATASSTRISRRLLP
jgi:hypothetical protein